MIRGRRTPPYKTAGLVISLMMTGVLVMVYWQFRGVFLDREKLTMISERAGLSMDPAPR